MLKIHRSWLFIKRGGFPDVNKRCAGNFGSLLDLVKSKADTNKENLKNKLNESESKIILFVL